MKKIPLSQGLFALVDDEDFEYLNQWKWQALRDHNTFYAVRNEKINGKIVHFKMHRVIMKTLANQMVDHRDHNGLNNQKYDLRNCTNQQNQLNQIKKEGCTSKYKGVYFNKTINKWIAHIIINYKRTHIGYFDTEDEAALAYNKKAKELFGEFAVLNQVLRKAK